VSDPYEPPPAPEVVLHTDREPVEGSVEQVLACLERLGLTAAVRSGLRPELANQGDVRPA
jgi:adenylylsulfate kinase-like enzyme